jgi:hypothetical protein
MLIIFFSKKAVDNMLIEGQIKGFSALLDTGILSTL